MEQKITININGNRYELTAHSPEEEEIFRKAAASVNNMLSNYTKRFADKDISQLLSFVALNESIGRLSLARKLEALEADTDRLEKQLFTYLETIDNQPPAITC